MIGQMWLHLEDIIHVTKIITLSVWALLMTLTRDYTWIREYISNRIDPFYCKIILFAYLNKLFSVPTLGTIYGDYASSYILGDYNNVYIQIRRNYLILFQTPVPLNRATLWRLLRWECVLWFSWQPSLLSLLWGKLT